MNLGHWLLACFVALSIGIAAGWQVKNWHIKSKQTDALVEVRKTDATTIATSQRADQALVREIDNARVAVTDSKREVIRYVTNRIEVPANCPAPVIARAGDGLPEPTVGPSAVVVLAADDRLPVGLVRLLNDARTGAVDRASAGSDAEGQAPSEVSAATFIDNDFDVVAEYHELAKRHDKLVDFVEDLQGKQRKRLGATASVDTTQ